MTEIDVINSVREIWENSTPNGRIRALQAARRLLPNDKKELFDAAVDLKSAGIKDDPNSITVVLVHGIQTDGAWQTLVQEEFRGKKNINVVGVGYNFYNGFQLFALTRSGPVEKVKREIRDLQRAEPNARLMVIAHSFGSYIVSRILRDAPDIRFERVVLCGSIVSRDFRWDVYGAGLDSARVVNDVGTNDIWPVVATACSLGYGASGRLGFQTARVTDRYFPYDHSDFFNTNHIKGYWLPFISEGVIARSDWDTKRPKTSLLVNLLTNWWQAKIFIVLLLSAFGGLGYYPFRLLSRFF